MFHRVWYYLPNPKFRQFRISVTAIEFFFSSKTSGSINFTGGLKRTGKCERAIGVLEWVFGYSPNSWPYLPTSIPQRSSLDLRSKNENTLNVIAFIKLNLPPRRGQWYRRLYRSLHIVGGVVGQYPKAPLAALLQRIDEARAPVLDVFPANLLPYLIKFIENKFYSAYRTQILINNILEIIIQYACCTLSVITQWVKKRKKK